MTIRITRAMFAASAFSAVVLAAVASWSADTVVTPPPSTAAGPASTPASGNVILNGNPEADACQEAAKIGDFNGTGVDECTLALARSQLMSTHDLAATYTDRGAIYMQHRQFVLAKADFDKALSIDPTVGNAYVNRGGALIAMKQYAAAIADIDRGLSLNPDEPEKAYFNRAIADENLGDLKSAYADYQKAYQINPNWAAVKAELSRFSRIQADQAQ